MAQIQGINVIAPIVPLSTEDQFPSHEAVYGKGGLRTIDTIANRNLISDARREEGMVVYVTAEGKFYQLKGGIANANWIPFSPGGANAKQVGYYVTYENLELDYPEHDATAGKWADIAGSLDGYVAFVYEPSLRDLDLYMFNGTTLEWEHQFWVDLGYATRTDHGVVMISGDLLDISAGGALSAVRQTTNDYTDADKAQVAKLTDYITVYIDAVNGNDTNDGLASNRALQTFANVWKFKDNYPYSYITVRVAAGTYTTSSSITFNDSSLCFADNVIINGNLTISGSNVTVCTQLNVNSVVTINGILSIEPLGYYNQSVSSGSPPFQKHSLVTFYGTYKMTSINVYEESVAWFHGKVLLTNTPGSGMRGFCSIYQLRNATDTADMTITTSSSSYKGQLLLGAGVFRPDDYSKERILHISNYLGTYESVTELTTKWGLLNGGNWQANNIVDRNGFFADVYVNGEMWRYKYKVNNPLPHEWIPDKLLESGVATTTTAGKVIVGSGLSVGVDGTLSADSQTDNNYTTTEKEKLANLDSSKFLGSFADLATLKTNYPESGTGAQWANFIGTKIGCAAHVEDTNVLHEYSYNGTNWVDTGQTSSDTPAMIKQKYESNADTNAYTNAEKTKLAGLSNYTLPVATSSVLGGVKKGNGVNIAADGTVSVDASATSISIDPATVTVSGIRLGLGGTGSAGDPLKLTTWTNITVSGFTMVPAGGTREVGNTLTGAIQFNWNIGGTDAAIATSSMNQGIGTVTSPYSWANSSGVNSNTTFTVTVSAVNNSNATANLSVSFVPARFWGVSAALPNTLTDAQIQQGTKDLTQSRSRTVTTLGATGYLWFAYPASMGNAPSIQLQGSLPDTNITHFSKATFVNAFGSIVPMTITWLNNPLNNSSNTFILN